MSNDPFSPFGENDPFAPASTKPYDIKKYAIAHTVIAKGTFLEGIQFLTEGTNRAIFGPQGGILILNEYQHVVFRCNPKFALLFTSADFLGNWEQWQLQEENL